MNIHCSVAALSLPVAAAVPVGTAASQPPERPNIVILYADDKGVGDVAAANVASKIPTPHLDRLAREGTRCTDAHSVSGICTPSRYALLHGRYHWRKFHGIVNSFDQPVMDPDRTTLPEMLRAKGYAIRHGDWALMDAKTGGVSAEPAWFDEANGYVKNTQPGELYNLRDDLS